MTIVRARPAHSPAPHSRAPFTQYSAFVRPVLVNGTAGVLVAPGGSPLSLLAFTVTDGRVVEIDAIADPERLSRLDLPILDEDQA
jgi:RNA polymerase sigma-70 factor (ECF subfamily)